MLTLGIDTTGAECSVALVDSARIHAYATRTIHRGHAEILAPMVQAVLRSANISAKDLAKISVCTGPGSFTGVRVGLSFAKGLALPWDIPVVGVSGLEVWARTIDPEGQKAVVSSADVRRGDLFWQAWNKGVPAQSPQLTNVDTRYAGVPEAELYVGSGAIILNKPDANAFVCPAILAWLGATRSADANPAEPLYHRPPDAKLPGGVELAKEST